MDPSTERFATDAVGEVSNGPQKLQWEGHLVQLGPFFGRRSHVNFDKHPIDLSSEATPTVTRGVHENLRRA